MTLESMVVSRDWQEVSVLECILGSLHIGVNVVTDAERALNRIARTKVDAVIVDRDLIGTDHLLESVRSSRCNGESVPVLLLSSCAERHNLPSTGATFFFEKPVSVEQAVRTLSAARNLMLNGRLRYHRQALEMPVSLSLGPRKNLDVQLMNLSRGGLRIRAPRPLDSRGPVKVRFTLPGLRSSVRATGEIAWHDGNGNAGIRFLEVPARLQRDLQLWLEREYFGR
jgi:PilZ domain